MPQIALRLVTLFVLGALPAAAQDAPSAPQPAAPGVVAPPAASQPAAAREPVQTPTPATTRDALATPTPTDPNAAAPAAVAGQPVAQAPAAQPDLQEPVAAQRTGLDEPAHRLPVAPQRAELDVAGVGVGCTAFVGDVVRFADGSAGGAGAGAGDDLLGFRRGAVEVVVVPPYTDLRSVQTLVDGDKLALRYGAQDLSQHDSGAYTGEISGAFLAKLGCTYAVVGHSERREYHAETDEVVAAKAAAAYRHGIVPIVCVGEGLEVRQAGTHVEHVVAQVRGSLAGLTDEQMKTVVVAYEPVWAIGTGEVATPEDAQEVCAAVRETLAEMTSQEIADGIRVLYGGSVKSGNVAAIMAGDDVDGALVGGASLEAEEFAAICRYQQHVTA